MATKKVPPTIEELARLKPNAKGDLYMITSEEIGYRYAPRLGRHIVRCEGDAALFENQEDALESAKKFLGQVRAGIVKKIGALNPQA